MFLKFSKLKTVKILIKLKSILKGAYYNLSFNAVKPF